MPEKLGVTFSQFRIREVFAKDSRELGQRSNTSGTMKISPQVTFACPEELEENDLHLILIVRLEAALLKGKSPKSVPLAVAAIEGEARFDLGGIGIASFNKLYDDMDFLDRLTDQVYPLVNVKLSDLLNDMGFNTTITLSLPEKEDQQVVSSEVNAIPGRTAARKPIARKKAQKLSRPKIDSQ